MNSKELKIKQRKARENFPDSLGLRVHRAISWLKRSEQCEDDLDAKFIFLWIAFNAAYSYDRDYSKLTEAQSFKQFLEKLCDLDKTKHLYSLIWSEFSTSIRLLIDNQFVFQPFWDYHNGEITEEEWKKRFTIAKKNANSALAKQNSPAVFVVVLSRLYTLRNQLIHGGSTWNGAANRDQLRDATNFLSKLVPIIINIMMDNAQTLWGDANYPLVEQ